MNKKHNCICLDLKPSAHPLCAKEKSKIISILVFESGEVFARKMYFQGGKDLLDKGDFRRTITQGLLEIAREARKITGHLCNE